MKEVYFGSLFESTLYNRGKGEVTSYGDRCLYYILSQGVKINECWARDKRWLVESAVLPRVSWVSVSSSDLFLWQALATCFHTWHNGACYLKAYAFLLDYLGHAKACVFHVSILVIYLGLDTKLALMCYFREQEDWRQRKINYSPMFH